MLKERRALLPAYLWSKEFALESEKLWKKGGMFWNCIPFLSLPCKWEKTASAFQPRMGCISLISQYLSELQIWSGAHIQATNHRQEWLVSLLCPWLIPKTTEDLLACGSHRPLFNILVLLPASSVTCGCHFIHLKLSFPICKKWLFTSLGCKEG